MIAKELRIGNWVRIPYANELIELELEDFTNFADGFDKVGRYKPIQLTEDVLLKCGFEITGEEPDYREWETKQIDGDVFSLSQFGHYHEEERDIVFYYELGGLIGVNKTIHYLHELQNLYFALTGEELKINL